MVKPPNLSRYALCKAAAEINCPAVELWYQDEDFKETVETGYHQVFRTCNQG